MMLAKDVSFIWSYNPANKLEDPQTVGKWIARLPLEQIVTLFPEIDYLVGDGRLYRAKYSHRENPATDPFVKELPVLIVYADDPSKARVRELLGHLLQRHWTWKYDWETKRDWSPGGELYRRARLEELLRMYPAPDGAAE